MQKFYRSQDARLTREVQTVQNTPRAGKDSLLREKGEGKKDKDFATLIQDSVGDVNPLIKVTDFWRGGDSDSQYNESISQPTETLNTDRAHKNQVQCTKDTLMSEDNGGNAHMGNLAERMSQRIRSR